ncbi:Mis12-Mtw1 protein family-domain-containing protein [Kalaharituber pfeilii]|nr:Mis12-Mtw1 protein family-domain-containing protein [Kalaharituber pfeilii]
MPATKRRREEKAPMTTSGIGNGRTGNVTIAQPKKAKTAVAYDEEDDGFVFTRKPRSTATRTAKRAPAPSLPPPPPSPPLGDSTPPAMLITPTRGSKARGAKTKRAVEKQPLELQRPPSLEPIPKQPLHKQPVPRQPLRQSNHQQDENSQNHHYYPNHQDVRHANVPKVLGYEQSMEDAGLRPITPPRPSPVLRRNNRSNKEAIEKVVIPLSDTPIIQRNKQFRNGSGGGSSSRRSSLGLRGRRASSLIDNGQVADPHSQLPSEDFYKHIDAELVEPRRMKQLLIWCAKRASMPPPLHNKMGGDGNANAIARIIEEEIMKDLLEKAELSNWFKRVSFDINLSPHSQSQHTQMPSHILHPLPILQSRTWTCFARK